MKNIFLLPTDKPSRLYLEVNKLKILKKGIISTKNTNQNIYIINDEPIKEGDWCLDYNKDLVKYNEDIHNMLLHTICKKIILTTDQDLIADGIQAIDDEFLEWFCFKNGKIDFVEVIAIEDENNFTIKYLKSEQEHQIERMSKLGINTTGQTFEQMVTSLIVLAENSYSSKDAREVFYNGWILNSSGASFSDAIRKWFEFNKK